MSTKVKDFIVGTIVFVVLTIIMGGCLYHCTSAEYWYAGMHDSKCENALRSEKCYCYERFIEADKKRLKK